jgi:hypothetical protein
VELDKRVAQPWAVAVAGAWDYSTLESCYSV